MCDPLIVRVEVVWLWAARLSRGAGPLGSQAQTVDSRHPEATAILFPFAGTRKREYGL